MKRLSDALAEKDRRRYAAIEAAIASTLEEFMQLSHAFCRSFWMEDGAAMAATKSEIRNLRNRSEITCRFSFSGFPGATGPASARPSMGTLA